MHTASFNDSETPPSILPRSNEPPDPKPPPHPPDILVQNVPESEFACDALFSTGVAFSTNDTCPVPDTHPLDNALHIWYTQMLPIDEIEDR